MKKYELKFDKDTHKIQRVSLVDVPAVGTGIVYFSQNKEDKTIFFDSDEKQIFYSIAMRPNTLIFRSNVSPILGEIEPAEVFYTPETVETIQQDYFKHQSNTQTNLNHDFKLQEGIFPFESWIVANAEIDKATALGLDVKKGDWVMAYKVDNPEIWQDVKDGKLTGLSIECNFAFHETDNINFKNEPMNKNEKTPESLWGMLKSYFSEEKEVEKTAEELEAEKLAKEKADADALKDKEEVMEVADPAAEMEAMKVENEQLKMKVADLEIALSKAEAKVVEKDVDVTKMAKEILEFSKQSGENDKPKKYEEMSNSEKARFNRGKL